MGSFSVEQDSQVPIKTGTSEPVKPKEEEKKRDDQKNSWVINWVPNQRGSFGIYRLAKSDNTNESKDCYRRYLELTDNYLSWSTIKGWENDKTGKKKEAKEKMERKRKNAQSKI